MANIKQCDICSKTYKQKDLKKFQNFDDNTTKLIMNIIKINEHNINNISVDLCPQCYKIKLIAILEKIKNIKV